MQHKSLFAAFLCGALCLTACLKNEESPSVTLVRQAKADEISANAEDLRAHAYATKILAEAEAALKNAQAKLQEANAKLIEAQADKEKAQAALYLAQAALQQAEAELKLVEVDQARVELQRRQEELKAQIAEYQARIAAADAEKTYWEYVKQLLAKELEIAMVEAEAALYDAQTDLVNSISAYNDAIRAAEQVEHQAEIDAANQAAQERQQLRDKVEELLGKYYAAAAELLNIEHNLIHTQMNITAAEEGIVSATALKGEMIEYNNREIARLQKVVDYLETLIDADPEDLKDQLTDLFCQADAQKTKTDAAVKAYDDAYDDMFIDKPNAAGTAPYKVTYNFTQKFFTSDAYNTLSDITWGIVYDDDNNPLYYRYGEIYNDVPYYLLVGDPSIDNNIFVGAFFDSVYDYNTYDWVGDIDGQLLYAYYYDGSSSFGEHHELVRYPELGEGIYFDDRHPDEYTTVDVYEFFPLEINRDGYQAYVDYADQVTENKRVANKEYFNEEIDFIVELETAVLDDYNMFLEKEKATIEKMDAKVDETITNFLADWDDVVAKYNAYNDAYLAYVQKYELDNNVERTEALIAYQKAYAAWQQLIADKPANLETDMTNAALEALVALIAWGLVELDKEEFEKKEDGRYDTWQNDLANAKITAGEKEGAFNAISNDYTDLENKLEASTKAYNDKKVVYDAALENYYQAMQDRADALAAWHAAGDPASGTLFEAKETAIINFANAQAGLTLIEGELTTLETTMNTDEANLAAKQAAYDNAKQEYEDALEALQTQVDYYPKSFDDAIAAAKAAYEEAEAKYNAAKAANDAYDAKIAAAKTAVDDAFAAWKAVAGDDTEWAAIDALYTDWQDAAAAIGNPVFELFRNYGVNSLADYGYADDSIFAYIIDDFEADFFQSEVNYWYYYGVFDGDFDMEEYIDELMWEAICDYFSGYMYQETGYDTYAWDMLFNDYYIRLTDDQLISYTGLDGIVDGEDKLFNYWWFYADDITNYVGQSPMGIWIMGHFLMGDFEDGFYDNGYTGAYYYSEYFSIVSMEACIEKWDVTIRGLIMDAIDEACDEELAEHAAIMDEIDDIMAEEAAYVAAIEDLNDKAAKLPELQIAAWQEQTAYTALQDEIAELYFVKYANAQDLADRIAQYKQDIQALVDWNEDWADITELEHQLTILKGMYELDLVEYDVKKAICDDLKAEFEAALAELKAATE